MPKTKTQDTVFSIIMVLCMVYAMTFFNLAIDRGLSYALFVQAIKEMWIEVILAFFVQRYIARKNADHIIDIVCSGASEPSPILIPVCTAAGNVMVMAPIMTFLVTLIHNGFVYNLGILWGGRVILNFPFALCIQIFYIGPLARLIYRGISKCFGWN